MTKFKNSSRRLLSHLVVPALATLLAATGQAVPTIAAETQISVNPAAYGATRKVELDLNKSVIIDLPAGVGEVVVSQPSIAGAIMRSRTRAIVQGMTGGDTNIFFLDDAGRTIQVLDVRVIEEPSQIGNALEAALARVIPGSNIKVELVTLGDLTSPLNRVVLTGTVLSGEDRDRATQVAVQFAGDPLNVANIINVQGSQQVMLQVTVSEIRRDVAKQMGINLSGTVTIGAASLGFNTNATSGLSSPDVATGSFPIGNVQINAALKALENRNALRLLAQPTLTATSGQPAEFLVGGEFPVPTKDDNGQVTVVYKEYGVKLKFTPTVKSNGVIGLVVDTGVSEVQPTNLYALTRRDITTSVELATGSTLAIGGLLSERTTQGIDQVPGLGDIPILGALFRSRAYQSQQTELVILVTPYLVAPSPVNSIPLPTDRSNVATDAEAVFLGKMETLYGVAGTGQFRGSISGSVGFVLD